MDPNAGLKHCERCGGEVWFENPAFPLCEKCSQQEPPAPSEPVETVEDTEPEVPAVKRPRGRRATERE
jgi:hypothetical protein